MESRYEPNDPRGALGRYETCLTPKSLDMPHEEEEQD